MAINFHFSQSDGIKIMTIKDHKFGWITPKRQDYVLWGFRAFFFI
jgi:hypothetical protein